MMKPEIIGMRKEDGFLYADYKSETAVMTTMRNLDGELEDTWSNVMRINAVKYTGVAVSVSVVGDISESSTVYFLTMDAAVSFANGGYVKHLTRFKHERELINSIYKNAENIIFECHEYKEGVCIGRIPQPRPIYSTNNGILQ